MKVWWVSCLLSALALAGCVTDDAATDRADERAGDDVDSDAGVATDTGGPAHDRDMDGIPDALEVELGQHCRIAGETCQSLGIAPPTPGVRDYILVQYGRSGPDQDWRVSEAVWDTVFFEVERLGVRLQVADLGQRDDVDPEASWDDYAQEGRYWYTWLRYERPDVEGSSGYNEWNLIGMQVHEEYEAHEIEEQHTITLLHEIYHSWLGELRSNQSQCADEEVGGSGHSNDPDSILYTDPDCYQQEDPSKDRLGTAEAAELASEPFENYAYMNSDAWWE